MFRNKNNGGGGDGAWGTGARYSKREQARGLKCLHKIVENMARMVIVGGILESSLRSLNPNYEPKINA